MGLPRRKTACGAFPVASQRALAHHGLNEAYGAVVFPEGRRTNE